MPSSSPKLKWPSIAFWLIAGAISLFAIWGVGGVPFHPDESTYLFMSADFDLARSNPASLAWEPGTALDLRAHYRAIDAPMNRYLLGLGRSLAGLPALTADWNWRDNWRDNRQAGALPDERLLQAGRLTITLLLPLSLFFIYLTGRRMGGEASGLLAVILLGSNALILLHTRRAMAEGALTFSILLALWSFLDGWKRPWLAGLGMAMALNAKHSTLALLPVGMLAVAWGVFLPATGLLGARLRKALVNLLIYGAMITLITLVLNPFYWRDPLAAARVSIKERNDLLERQVADTLRLAPENALLIPGQRTVALLANLFVLPPAFAEVGQYQAYTAAAEQAYLATPGNDLLRGMAGGGVMLGLVLLGVGLALVDYRHNNLEQRRALALVGLATISLTLLLIAAVPLSWQRYVIPLVPLACLWAAYPASLVEKIKQNKAGDRLSSAIPEK
jgi:hypothetical protein